MSPLTDLCLSSISVSKFADSSMRWLSGQSYLPDSAHTYHQIIHCAPCTTDLCFSSTSVSKFAESCCMSDRSTGWVSGQGDSENTVAGSIVRQMYSTSDKSVADKACRHSKAFQLQFSVTSTMNKLRKARCYKSVSVKLWHIHRRESRY